MKRNIAIFDSTLRDGEQTPGAKLNEKEKLDIAMQLARLNVDVIEAGFPISSPGDLKACKNIARQVSGPVITALARTVKEDIDCVWEAVKEAERPRIHIVLGASDIHINKKLRSNPEKIIDTAVNAVKYAKKLTSDIEYSLEDATRAKREYIYEIIDKVIKAGATVINIPDTVGYTVPEEYGDLLRSIREKVPSTDKVIISVHCHNDLGLAVANSLSAVKNGAEQIECNINGIGERAGNASLEEIVLALKIRSDFYDFDTNVNIKEIYRTSRMVSKLTGIPVPVNKAIVGINAFAHSSGIHQDGILKDKETYEIIDAESIGRKPSEIIFTARSGRHAVKHVFKQLGYKLNDDIFEVIFEKFLDLADKKKEVFKEDLEALVSEYVKEGVSTYKLKYIKSVIETDKQSTCSIILNYGKEELYSEAQGNGPVDAAFKAINEAISIEPQLLNYDLHGVTRGQNALGEVSLSLEHEGKMVSGKGTSTNVVEASVRAYLQGVNQIFKES